MKKITPKIFILTLILASLITTIAIANTSKQKSKVSEEFQKLSEQIQKENSEKGIHLLEEEYTGPNQEDSLPGGSRYLIQNNEN